jgi:hypothetical protein
MKTAPAGLKWLQKDPRNVRAHLEPVLSLLTEAAYIDAENTIASTLLAGGNSQYSSATKEQCQDFTVWVNYLESHGKLAPYLRGMDQTQGDTETTKAAHYQFALMRACLNRLVFATSSGHFGLGPQTTKDGDIVAILYGCQWPVVLRKIEAYYKVIGLSYVHGLMYGEAVRACRDEMEPDIRFEIR